MLRNNISIIFQKKKKAQKKVLLNNVFLNLDTVATHEVNSLDNRSDISEMKKYNFFVPEYKLSSE